MNNTHSATDQMLRSGHRERLRTRFKTDPSSLTDAEVLELVLGYIYVRRDNNLLAKRLLHEKGSLSAVCAASAAQLEQVDGCGSPVSLFFWLIRELQARCATEQAEEKGPVTLREAAEIGKKRLGACTVEIPATSSIQCKVA